MARDLAKKEDALAFMEEDWLERIRDHYHQFGTIHPQAAIFATKDEKGAALDQVRVLHVSGDEFFEGTPPEPGAEVKDLFAHLVRGMCMKLRAVGVAMAMECWHVTMTLEERKRIHQVADHPDRREILLASLDHLAFPHSLHWETPIQRIVTTNGFVGTFQRKDQGNPTKGRFSNLFPRKLWS